MQYNLVRGYRISVASTSLISKVEEKIKQQVSSSVYPSFPKDAGTDLLRNVSE
jgi:hypothetical protein